MRKQVFIRKATSHDPEITYTFTETAKGVLVESACGKNLNYSKEFVIGQVYENLVMLFIHWRADGSPLFISGNCVDSRTNNKRSLVRLSNKCFVENVIK